MLAIQAPSDSTLITPARRDSPRPTAIVRSASLPRPKISRLPSGTFTTSPVGVLTCAVTVVVGWIVIRRSSGRRPAGTVAAVWSVGRPAGAGFSPESGVDTRRRSGLAVRRGELGGMVRSRVLSREGRGEDPLRAVV